MSNETGRTPAVVLCSTNTKQMHLQGLSSVIFLKKIWHNIRMIQHFLTYSSSSIYLWNGGQAICFNLDTVIIKFNQAECSTYGCLSSDRCLHLLPKLICPVCDLLLDHTWSKNPASEISPPPPPPSSSTSPSSLTRPPSQAPIGLFRQC